MEKNTDKYRLGVALLRELESDSRHPLSDEEMADMDPTWMYSYLYDEWWREWNGLTQEWEKSRI